MDKISCDIINDIMPLYVDEMVSDAAKTMLEEHIAECSGCRNRLNEMQKEFKIPSDNIITPMASLKKKLFQKKLCIILLSVITALTITILGLIYLTSPVPLKYDKSLIRIEKLDNYRVLATISKEVDGYSIDSYPSDTDTSGGVNTKHKEYIYHITLWNSLWNEYIKKGEERSFIINKNDAGGYNTIKSIYYYSENIKSNETVSSSDLLIYGKDAYISGGVVTLPRLLLNYYFIIAFIIAAASGAICLLLKKNVKIRSIAEKMTLLSISYIISHICVKGFHSSSYYLMKDLSGILLLTLPIFCIMLIFSKLKNEHNIN